MRIKNENLAELKFRPLKRQLQKLFKEMQFDIRDGVAPAAGLVAEFTRQAETMASYPGFGDKNYPAFLDAVRQLSRLHSGTILSVWQRQLDNITELRRHCHESFKKMV